jgi:hypothetical protein
VSKAASYAWLWHVPKAGQHLPWRSLCRRSNRQCGDWHGRASWFGLACGRVKGEALTLAETDATHPLSSFECVIQFAVERIRIRREHHDRDAAPVAESGRIKLL